MWAAIIGAVTDSFLKALFGWISEEMEKRNLIAQGKAAQYQADLQSTVKAGADATQIRTQVDSQPIADVDRDLERLRQRAASGQ